MNDNEDFINKEPIKQMLSELGKHMHLPPETILAYAHGVLSQDGRSKVASHIKDCKECAEVFDFAKKFLKAEQEFDSEDLKSKSAVHLSPRVKSKLELVALLNSKKDELVKETAKLFLPQDSWTYIEAAVVTKRKSEKTSSCDAEEDMHNFPVSTSTGLPEEQLSPEEKCAILVEKIIDFVDFANELIIEQCEGIKDIEHKLAGCVDGAIVVLDALELDKQTMESIEKIFNDIGKSQRSSNLTDSNRCTDSRAQRVKKFPLTIREENFFLGKQRVAAGKNVLPDIKTSTEDSVQIRRGSETLTIDFKIEPHREMSGEYVIFFSNLPPWARPVSFSFNALDLSNKFREYELQTQHRYGKLFITVQSEEEEMAFIDREEVYIGFVISEALRK